MVSKINKVNEVIKNIIERRSVRSYLDKKIEKEKLEIIMEAAIYAPSGSNKQYNHFLVIEKESVLESLKKMVVEEFSQMVVSNSTYISVKNGIMKARGGYYDFIFNAPAFVIIANKKNHPNAYVDSAVAAENIMLAAKSIDIGSCYLNHLRWLNENTKINNYLKTIGLKTDERVYASLSLGYIKEYPTNKVERHGNIVDYIF